jgi:hypothetical protein
LKKYALNLFHFIFFLISGLFLKYVQNMFVSDAGELSQEGIDGVTVGVSVAVCIFTIAAIVAIIAAAKYM